MLDLGACEANNSCLFLSNSRLQHSGTMQPINRCISVKGKKVQSLSPSALGFQEMQRRNKKYDPWGSLQVARRECTEKVKVGYRVPYLEEFQIQLAFDTSGFKLSSSSRHCRCRLFQEHRGGCVVCCQWTVKFLYQNDCFDSHFFPQKCQN